MCIIFGFFKALIDNQLLHSVLKGFAGDFAEMYFDCVCGVPQLQFETVGLLSILSFCHILCPFPMPNGVLQKNRAHRLVSIRSDAVLLIQLRL